MSVINVSTAQVVVTISTGGANPFAVQVSPDGTRLFIGTNGTAVLIVDTGTNQIIGSTDVGSAPNAFVVAPDNRIIYVSAFVGGTVTELDLFTGTALRTFSIGGTPQGMAITRKGDRLYVANEAGFLTEVTLQTGSITATMPLAGGGFGVGVTADDNQAWVTIPSQGKVQVFGLQNHHLSLGLTVGGEPRRLGFSQHGAIGAIANMAGSSRLCAESHLSHPTPLAFVSFRSIATAYEWLTCNPKSPLRVPINNAFGVPSNQPPTTQGRRVSLR